MAYSRILILLFITFQLQPLYSQPYLNETSTWKQFYKTYGLESIMEYDALIQFDGDTIIGNTTYYKVLETGMVKTSYTCCPASYAPIYNHRNPIREENKSFYAYNIVTNKEYLLYDFDLIIGDTIKTGCNKDTIVSIDTVFMGNIPRQRFHLLATPFTLIEGIGSTVGFYWQTCNGISSIAGYLQCYCQNGDCISFPTFWDPNPECDSLVTNIRNIEFTNFSITPNPFDNEIQIQSTWLEDSDATIYIFNLTGDLIMKKKIHSNTIFESVNVTSLSPGIYFIGIQNNGVINFKKMIKL